MLKPLLEKELELLVYIVPFSILSAYRDYQTFWRGTLSQILQTDSWNPSLEWGPTYNLTIR